MIFSGMNVGKSKTTQILILSLCVSGMFFLFMNLSDSEVSEDQTLPLTSGIFDENRYVELVVAIDPEFSAKFNHNNCSIVNHILQVVNKAQEIYYSSFNISILFMNITYFNTTGSYEIDYIDEGNDNSGYSYSDLLMKFNTFRQTPEFPHHDYAVILSGKEFYSTVRGYAAVAGVGTTHAAGAILQSFDVAYDSFNLVHEMGHGFAMLHDGASDSCDPHQYIMTSTPNMDYTGLWEFSACSVTYITQFFIDYSSTMLGLNSANTNFATYSIDVPGDKAVDVTSSGNTLNYNISGIYQYTIMLNGEPYSLGTCSYLSTEINLDLDTLGLRTGINNITILFNTGEYIPIQSEAMITVLGGANPQIHSVSRSKVWGNIDVEWSEPDTPETDDFVYRLYCRDADDSEWTLIADDIQGLSYKWDTRSVPNGENYHLRVLALSDEWGVWLSDSSDDIFQIKNNEGFFSWLPFPSYFLLIGVGGLAALAISISIVVVAKKRKTKKIPT